MVPPKVLKIVTNIVYVINTLTHGSDETDIGEYITSDLAKATEYYNYCCVSGDFRDYAYKRIYSYDIKNCVFIKEVNRDYHFSLDMDMRMIMSKMKKPTHDELFIIHLVMYVRDKTKLLDYLTSYEYEAQKFYSSFTIARGVTGYSYKRMGVYNIKKRKVTQEYKSAWLD